MNYQLKEIENNILKSYLNLKERELLRIYFHLKPKNDTFESVIENTNLEDNRNFLVFVAQICYENNSWCLIDNRIRERIKGVYHYYQISNAMMLKTLDKIIKEFNRKGIPTILVKGDAMRLYFDPKKVRLMSDIDLVVSKENFNNAKKILEIMGAKTIAYADHSETFVLDNTEIDLHHTIFKFYEEKDSGIYNRLNKIDVHNNYAYVLSDLDMFIHLMVTQTYAFILGEYSNRHIKWLYDSYVLWMRLEDKDIRLLSLRLAELHCLNSFYFSYRLFVDCFPEVKTNTPPVIPDKNYEEWIIKNYSLVDIRNRYNKERAKYDINTFSFRTIFLQLKYHIPFRKYQYIRLNSEDRNYLSFVSYLYKEYGFNNFQLFKKRVLDRFRLKEKTIK